MKFDIDVRTHHFHNEKTPTNEIRFLRFASKGFLPDFAVCAMQMKSKRKKDGNK
jgi:hypothetical protein